MQLIVQQSFTKQTPWEILLFPMIFFVDHYKNYYRTLNAMNKKIYNALKKNKIIKHGKQHKAI